MELKPCPWCGETPAPETEVGSTHRWRRVVGCCTPGPEIRHNPDLTYQENHEAAIAAWNTRPAPTDEQVEAAKWIRAWRNRFTSERMNAYPNDPYEVCRAKAEADANDFEEAFRERMARAALGSDPV